LNDINSTPLAKHWRADLNLQRCKTITHEINNFTLYNSQYIDRIDITVYNPKTISKDSIFRKNIYNATVYFLKK
jgi:hypothetical protein